MFKQTSHAGAVMRMGAEKRVPSLQSMAAMSADMVDDTQEDAACVQCDFVGKNARALMMHEFKKHRNP